MLRIKGDDLYEGSRKISDRYYTGRAATLPAEFRAHHLAGIAFSYGADEANACVEGFDRAGLPEMAILNKREHCNCGDVKIKLTAHLAKAMEQLSEDEWKWFTAPKHRGVFEALETLWQGGFVLKATQPESPQFWFRLENE